MDTFIDYATYWPIFPLWLLIATTAMSTWIDWAIFWAPLLIFVFKIPPEIAIACWILIEVFGFGSWVYSYFLKKKILFKQVFGLLCIAISCGLVWAMTSKIISNYYLYLILGLSTFILMIINIRRVTKFEYVSIYDTTVNEIEMPQIRYKTLWNVLNAIWWFMTGTIWVWLWEVNNYYFINKNKLIIPYASWNSVFLIAFTAFFCSLFNIMYFWNHLEADQYKEIYSIVFFAIPAVIVWWRLWSLVAHQINPKYFYLFVWFLFFWVSLLSFYRMSLIN